MKERLIGDDQLLVTADTTMGDPLWDWVAADAARRAPDGWRIANIGAVSTGAGRPEPGLRLRAAAHRRHALDPVPPVSPDPAPQPPRTRTQTARPTRRARRSDRTRVRRLPKRGHYDRATDRRDPRRGDRGPRRLGPRRPAVRDADQRLARRATGSSGTAPRPAGMLRATDGQPVCVTVTHLDGFVLARSGFNHSVNYRSVMVLGTAHLVTDEAEIDAALERLHRAPLPRSLRRRCAR